MGERMGRKGILAGGSSGRMREKKYKGGEIRICKGGYQGHVRKPEASEKKGKKLSS